MLAATPKAMKAGSAIIDGEIVATTEDGNPRFLELMRDGRNVSFVAFDVMWLYGQDLRELPLAGRKKHLCSILPRRSPKRLADSYRPGSRWWKIKNRAYSQAEGRGELFERPTRTD